MGERGRLRAALFNSTRSACVMPARHFGTQSQLIAPHGMVQDAAHGAQDPSCAIRARRHESVRRSRGRAAGWWGAARQDQRHAPLRLVRPTGKAHGSLTKCPGCDHCNDAKRHCSRGHPAQPPQGAADGKLTHHSAICCYPHHDEHDRYCHGAINDGAPVQSLDRVNRTERDRGAKDGGRCQYRVERDSLLRLPSQSYRPSAALSHSIGC